MLSVPHLWRGYPVTYVCYGSAPHSESRLSCPTCTCPPGRARARTSARAPPAPPSSPSSSSPRARSPLRGPQHLRRTVRYGTVRHGTVWYGTMRYGTVRYGTVWHGTIRYGTVRYGTVRYGTVRYGTIRYGMIRYITVYYGMLRYEGVTVRVGRVRRARCPGPCQRAPCAHARAFVRRIHIYVYTCVCICHLPFSPPPPRRAPRQ